MKRLNSISRIFQSPFSKRRKFKNKIHLFNDYDPIIKPTIRQLLTQQRMRRDESDDSDGSDDDEIETFTMPDFEYSEYKMAEAPPVKVKRKNWKQKQNMRKLKKRMHTGAHLMEEQKKDEATVTNGPSPLAYALFGPDEEDRVSDDGNDDDVEVEIEMPVEETSSNERIEERIKELKKMDLDASNFADNLYEIMKMLRGKTSLDEREQQMHDEAASMLSGILYERGTKDRNDYLMRFYEDERDAGPDTKIDFKFLSPNIIPAKFTNAIKNALRKKEQILELFERTDFLERNWEMLAEEFNKRHLEEAYSRARRKLIETEHGYRKIFYGRKKNMPEWFKDYLIDNGFSDWLVKNGYEEGSY